VLDSVSDFGPSAREISISKSSVFVINDSEIPLQNLLW
jgi:hypothetical protein